MNAIAIPVQETRAGGARLRSTGELLATAATLPWTGSAGPVERSAGSTEAKKAPARRRLPRPRVTSQAAQDLLADAARGLSRAMAAEGAAERYAAAHLAALRAAAAVLAARARPVRGRRGSAWDLLAKVAPEFAEWAAFFAAGSAKRQAAEAGISRLIGEREADDMVRQSGAFLALVEEAVR